MFNKSVLHGGRCVGSMTVGPRGQVVIPASVRKELAINTGETLLVFEGFNGQAIMLLKTDVVEQMISDAGKRLASVERILKRAAPPKAAAPKRNGRRRINAQKS